MPSKREVLGLLTRDELLVVVDVFELIVGDRRIKEGLIEVVAASRKATLEMVLSGLLRERLKDLCRAFDLDDSGREKDLLIERLLGTDAEAEQSAQSDGDGEDDDEGPESAGESDDYECEAGATIAEAAVEDREYQAEALKELQDEFAEHEKVVLSLPTGAGKTFVAAKWLADTLQPDKRGQPGRALWLTHRAELVKQAEDELRRIFGPKRPVTRWTSTEKDGSGEVVIATVGCRDRPEGPFEVLVVDEAHHRAAPSYKRWAKAFRFERELGLTATPERHDQLGLGYEGIVKRSFWDLVEQRYLAAPIHHTVRTDGHYDLRKDRLRDDFEEASLRQLDNPKRNNVIVQQFLAHAAEYGKTLVFAINVAHADNLVAMFRESAPHLSVASILGTTDKAERAKLVADFEAGRINVLINCKVFVEGFNCRDIQTIFLTRPTMSAALYCQMVGRGTRIVGTKKTFHLIEFQDQLSQYADKLAGFWNLGERDANKIRERTERAKIHPADPPALLSPAQTLQWSSDLHLIGGVLAYWDRTALIQGATLVFKNEVDPVAGALSGGVVDRSALGTALTAGHWSSDEKQRLTWAVQAGLDFYLYDFRRVDAVPPLAAPAAVAAIHTTATAVAHLSKVEAFLGPSEDIDWGGDAAEWRREFLSEQHHVMAVLRITDVWGDGVKVVPQKVFKVEDAQVRSALSEIEDARRSSGEIFLGVVKSAYDNHLKATSITEYKWLCIASALRQGKPTLLDLREVSS